jgi:hypothetical protein
MTTAMTGAIRAGQTVLRAFAGSGARSSLSGRKLHRVHPADRQECSLAPRDYARSAMKVGLLTTVMAAKLFASTPAYSQQETIVVPFLCARTLDATERAGPKIILQCQLADLGLHVLHARSATGFALLCRR